MHDCGEENTTAFVLPRFAPVFLKGPVNVQEMMIDPKQIAESWLALHHVVVPVNGIFVLAAEALEDGVGPISPIPLSSLWYGPLTFKRASAVAPFDVTLVRATQDNKKHRNNTKLSHSVFATSMLCQLFTLLTGNHQSSTETDTSRQILNALKLLSFDESTPAIAHIDHTLGAPAATQAGFLDSKHYSSNLRKNEPTAASPQSIMLQIPTKRAKVCVLSSTKISRHHCALSIQSRLSLLFSHV